MLENALKSWLGKTFIISHFLLILLVITFRYAGKFDISATKTALAILIPILMTYATAMLIDMVKHRHRTGFEKNVPPHFSFLVLFVPCLFILFITGIITKQALLPDSTENFTVFLSLGESVFGIYMGSIFRVLFTPNISL